MKSIFAMIALVMSTSAFAKEYPADNSMLLKDLPNPNSLDGAIGGRVAVLNVKSEIFQFAGGVPKPTLHEIQQRPMFRSRIRRKKLITSTQTAYGTILYSTLGETLLFCTLANGEPATVGEAIRAFGKNENGENILSIRIREIDGAIKNLRPGPKF